MDNEKFVTRSRQWRETVSILLVEDDTTFAEMVRAQLRRMPWVEARLEIASTLRAALEKMAVEPFGLVVADLNLPDSKGLDTLAALSRVGDQPILILSGDKDPAVRAGVIDGGAYDFLSKDNLSAAALERLVRLASIQANTYSLVRETEARFQGLLKLSSEWYWEQDEELRFSRYDGPAGERAGNQPQATIGKHRWEIEGVTPVSSSWDEHRRQLEARQPFRDFEYSRISEDGVRYVAVSGEPLFDARGEFRGYRGIARDVTDRKRADEELQRFRLAMDSSADMIVLIDRASMRFVDVNRTACALLGYTREELLAMSPDQVLPVSRAELEKAYDEFIADPSRITGMSSYYRCKDGSTLPFESTRRVLRSGSSWIIAAISRDIRERIAVEKALHDSNERFRSLNALSSDWYWEQDSEFRLTFMSSIEKLGLDPTKYLGGRRWDQPALNLGEADWARHRAQLERHEPFQDFEMERPGESGTVWLSLSGQPVFDEAGRFTGYRGIGRDITERKREERLKGLEHAVTRYLAEADDERGALQGVMRVVCETEKWDCGRYYDMDGDAGVLRLLEAWATPASGVEKALEASRAVTFEPGVGLGGRAWQTGEPLWIADIQNDPRAGKRVLLRDSGMRGGFAFPVIAGGAPIGSLVFNAREVRPPEQRLLQATRVIGSQVGQFLQRKRAESKAGRLARMNVALAAANEAILRAKTSQEAFERACQIAVEAGSFLIGTVFVIDPKTRTLSRAAANGRAAELVHPVQPTFDTADPAGKGLIGEACRTGRPAISNDYDADPRTASVQPRAYEVGSAAVFPLHVDGELFGVFGLQHAQRGAFSEELTALLQRLADNIAFALESFRANKRRRAAKRKLAESEQRFRSLTGLSSDMYWEQDEEHRFTALSDSGPKALNSWRRQNMVGKRRWDQRYFNMTEAGWEAHRAKLAAREPFFDLELGRFNEAGEKVWVTVSGEPFFDEAGKFRGYRGIGKEITERKRAAQLRELEHSVTRSLAEANSVSEALRGAMRAVCETEGWECGRFYYADDKTGLLHLGESWGVESDAVQRYLAGMRDITYALGTGLTGRVWQSGEPLWVRDIHNDSRVAQAGLAREADIHGAFIFPALSEGRTMGVLAFNSRDIRQPEEDLLQAVGVIGSQIGQYLQRKEVEASRLRDEEALRRFRAAMDTSGDIILLIDRETMRYVDVNVTACERIGYTREEIMALGPEQLTPIPRAELERAYDAIIESGEITTVRGVQFCKNRPSFPTEVMRRSVRSGGRWLIVAVVRDITQRLAAEEALGRSEARFRSLTNLSSDWYWEQDAEFRFTKFEGKGSAEGYSPASLIIGKCIWDLPGIVAGTVDWAAHRTTLERHESFRNIQYSYRVRSGAVFYVSVDGEPVFDDSGRFLGYRGTSRDITRQRRDEEELRRFRAAMDMSLDAIYLTDRASMRFIDVNAAACRGIGRTRAEMLEMGPHDLLQETRASLEAEYDAVIAQGDVGTRSETSYSAKDGTRRWTELHRRALRADESWIIVSISRDITERKRAEQRQAQYVRHQERVARFGQSALAKREPGELVREAVQNVLEGLAADAVAYFERGKGDTELILHALVGAGEGGDGTAVKCGESNPVQRVLRSGAAQVVDGAELEFDWATGLHAAVIPVRGERNARGALCVCYRAASAFAADALNFVEAVASVLSAGLQRIESESRLAFLAQFDSLTGLPNRALLADRFSQMIVLAKRRSASLSVLFVDLDEFKMVNDTLGHSGGDQLLKEVAVRLQACVRSGDTVARISGDEFAVILADMAQPEDAAIVAQKIIDRLAAAFEVHGNEVFISGSIGIAAYPGDGADAEALIGAADAAMYRAKQAGRNNFQFFTAEINQRTRNRALLGTELRRALEREEFVLYYQPKVELANRRFYGAEALIRWKHPERGLVSPAEFIPVLEETGLIVPVGEWVLKRACEDLKAWQAAGLDVGPVAVNLSARQFRLQDLDARLKAVVAETGIDPSLIELEITESQLMVDPDHAIRVMRSLCDAGMRISIDDFGTGYSSLAYLTRFPVGALKIDRSFVADVNKDPSDATIVRTIIEMAHSLGFTVVAEGVETEDQATFLRLLRCERAQGYLFAKPMPAADLVKLFSPKAS